MVLFVFQFSRVCNFGKFNNFGFDTVRSERVQHWSGCIIHCSKLLNSVRVTTLVVPQLMLSVPTIIIVKSDPKELKKEKHKMEFLDHVLNCHLPSFRGTLQHLRSLVFGVNKRFTKYTVRKTWIVLHGKILEN